MKKTVSLLLSIIMIAGVFASLPLSADAAKEYIYGGFKYIVEDDEAVITGYTSLVGDIEIPAVIITAYDEYPVTKIGYSAFYDNDEITSVVIPDTVSEIDDLAFSDCSGMQSVEIPDNVERIGVEAFQYCDSLTSVTIPETVALIDDNAFYYCEVLEEVELNLGTTQIGAHAFFGCAALKSVTIPESVTEIGEKAFGYHYKDKQYLTYDGFTICGYDDTAAESYALTNGFTFTSISPLEVYTHITNWKTPYTGKAIKPAVTVTDSKGNTLVKGVDYTLVYPKSPVNAGSYVINIVLKGSYAELGTEYALYYITLAKNPMTVKGLTKTVKYKTVQKKNVTVTVLSVKNSKGKVTYKKTSGSSKITVDKKTGKFTVKKGIKKGNYSVKVKVTDDGGRNYKEVSKTVTAVIKVK